MWSWKVGWGTFKDFTEQGWKRRKVPTFANIFLLLTGLLLYLSGQNWITTKTIKWKMRCSCFFSLKSSHLRLSKSSLNVIWLDLISWWIWYWLNRWKAANILSSFNMHSQFTLNHSLPSLISPAGFSSLLIVCRFVRTFAACWHQGARDNRVHHQVGALPVQVQTGEAALEPVPGLDLLRQGRHDVLRSTSCDISETVNVMIK